ncbi:MAG: [ribosomal protein S5]-alanine N-acetyltransferase [Frankiales bacterium]|nr:[ribosomal protein S5]-alanine N-acetyltransferase [Frankiales bacterium]
MSAGWPVKLRDGNLVLRPLRLRDARRWIIARRTSAEWLAPWEVTPPGQRTTPPASLSVFAVTLSRLRADAEAGNTLPFAVVLDGSLVGQVTLGNLGREPREPAYVGYWVDRAYAGRGIIPRALALVLEHAFATLDLPRVEANIQPDNDASRRVVEKLGFRLDTLRPGHLHVAGAWRDHLRYELSRENAADGLLSRTRPVR